MRYAHMEYTDRAGHPTGVCTDAVCMGVGYTAATVRLVCRITCKIMCKIRYTIGTTSPQTRHCGTRKRYTQLTTFCNQLKSISQSARFFCFWK
jgi:hypothetical protein